MNLATIKGWIDKRGYPVRADSPILLRVRWRAEFADKKPLPHLYVQYSENWIVLSALPVDIAPAFALVGLPRALLAFNRSIQLVKFALGDNDEVVLCAELPTESLDESELMWALDALLDALKKYGDYGRITSV
jgi:hypothetical protein